MPTPADGVRRLDRLGHETAPYQLLFEEDLPEEWKRAPDAEYLEELAQALPGPRGNIDSHVCVELPDYAWAHHYEKWSRGAAEVAVAAGRKPLVVMLSSQHDFRNLPTADQRKQQATECLRNLAIHGKPLPLFARAFSRTPW
jgi:hypothetical protein